MIRKIISALWLITVVSAAVYISPPELLTAIGVILLGVVAAVLTVWAVETLLRR